MNLDLVDLQPILPDMPLTSSRNRRILQPPEKNSTHFTTSSTWQTIESSTLTGDKESVSLTIHGPLETHRGSSRQSVTPPESHPYPYENLPTPMRTFMLLSEDHPTHESVLLPGSPTPESVLLSRSPTPNLDK